MRAPQKLCNLSSTGLVQLLIAVASRNNEMDCREELSEIEREVLRRLRRTSESRAENKGK